MASKNPCHDNYALAIGERNLPWTQEPSLRKKTFRWPGNVSRPACWGFVF